jgi:beta-glucanase (GH16 family)
MRRETKRAFLIMTLRFVSCFLSAVFFAGAEEVPLQMTPVAMLTYETKAGSFYQLEARRGGQWQSEGKPFEGTGEKMTRVHRFAPTVEVRLKLLENQWVTIWRDEFEGGEIDVSKWSHEENGYGGGNNERQYYSAAPKYSFVKDGMLHLRAYRDSHTTSDGKVQPYTSARLRTLHRGEWTYGRFEIRAKLPSGQGMWPAVWMLPTDSPDGTWAASGEIDIIESRGSNVHETLGTLHFGGAWPDNQHKGGTYQFPKQDAAEAFHVYALEWKRDEISWFVDGEKWQTISKEDWNSKARPESETAPFDQPFHLLINLAVDGGFFAETDQLSEKLPDSAFPQTMLVDYVRVQKWAD